MCRKNYSTDLDGTNVELALKGNWRIDKSGRLGRCEEKGLNGLPLKGKKSKRSSDYSGHLVADDNDDEEQPRYNKHLKAFLR